MSAPGKVTASFVGVFLAGAIFGGAIVWRLEGPPATAPAVSEQRLQPIPAAPVGRPQVAGPNVATTPVRPGSLTPALMRQLTQRLRLTPDQRERIRPLVLSASEDLQKLRQESLAGTARRTEQMYAEVSALLTPEQRTELETMRRQLQERVQAERKRRADAAAAEAAARAKF